MPVMWAFIGQYMLFIVTAIVVRRPIALLVPIVVVPGFYIGLKYGWWGYGLGDSPFWIITAWFTLVAVGVAGIIIVIARIVWWLLGTNSRSSSP